MKTKLLYPAGALVIALCAIEFISFIFFSIFRERFDLHKAHPYTVTQADIPRLKRLYDFTLGWKKHFSTAFGERPRRRVYGRPLLAAFGDSFTYCEEVRDEETWEEQLAAMLSGDVYNFGVGAYGTDQAYLRFRQDSSKVGTPLVTLGLITENINRIVNRYRPFYFARTGYTMTKPRFILHGQTRELIENPVRNENELGKLLDAKFVASLGESDWWFDHDNQPVLGFPYTAILFHQRLWLETFHRFEGHQVDDISPRPWINLWTDPAARDLMFSILDSFMAESKAAGQRPFVNLLPNQNEVLSQMQGKNPGKLDVIFSYCRSRGYPCFDGAAALAKNAQTETELNKLFTHHLTPLGNRILASDLQAFLIEQKLIDQPVSK